MKYTCLVLIVILVFLTACAPKTACEGLEVQIGEECCLDQDLNAACDNKEAAQEAATAPAEEVPAESAVIEPMPEDVAAPVIAFRGREGFFPEEVKIKAGEKVIFRNEIPGKSSVVVFFQKEFTSQTWYTPIIKYNQEKEQIFTEAGNYKCWLLEYNPRCSIIVE